MDEELLVEPPTSPDEELLVEVLTLPDEELLVDVLTLPDDELLVDVLTLPDDELLEDALDDDEDVAEDDASPDELLPLEDDDSVTIPLLLDALVEPELDAAPPEVVRQPVKGMAAHSATHAHPLRMSSLPVTTPLPAHGA
ncbi:MAG: hypothetical protein AB2A00_16395 [Myxococcota bacterium]